MIYFNIRSTSSTSEKLRNFFVKCSNSFSISSGAETNSFNITCVAETWSTDKDLKDNSNSHLLNLNFVNQARTAVKRGADWYSNIHITW